MLHASSFFTSSTGLDFEVEEDEEDIWDTAQELFSINPSFSPSLLSEKVLKLLLPWALSNLLRDSSKGSKLLDTLSTPLDLCCFRSFTYFFKHNKSNLIIYLLDRHLTGISCREAAINLLLIFTCCNNVELTNDSPLWIPITQCLDFLAGVDRIEFRRNSLIDPRALDNLWKNPITVACLINLLASGKAVTAKDFIIRLFENFPSTNFESDSYALEVTSNLSFSFNGHMANFEGLPQSVINALYNFIKRRVTTLASPTSLSPNTTSGCFREIVVQLFFNEENRNVSQRTLSEDLSAYNIMATVMSANPEKLCTLFVKKWKKKKTVFFSEVCCYLDYPFIQFLSENDIKELIPSDAVGNSVLNWMAKVQCSSEYSRINSSERRAKMSGTLRHFGKILSKGTDRSDPKVPDKILKSGDPIQRECALLYLYNVCLHLRVEDSFKDSLSFFKLVQEEDLNNAHLFLQSLECWENGAFQEFSYPAKAPYQSPFSWTFRELMVILSHEENLSLLSRCTPKVPSVAECKSIQERLQIFDQMSDVQGILLYYPCLTGELLSYLQVDESWLLDLKEKKWLGTGIDDLWRCKDRLLVFRGALSSNFLQFIHQATTTQISVIFKYYAQVSSTESENLSTYLLPRIKGLIDLTTKNINSLLEHIEKKCVAVMELKTLLALLRENGRSFQEETRLLSQCESCSWLRDETRREALHQIFSEAVENILLFNQAIKLFCPSGQKNVFQKFAFRFYENDVCLCDVLLHVLSVLQDNAPNVNEKSLEDFEDLIQGKLSNMVLASKSSWESRRLLLILESMDKVEHIWNFFNENPSFCEENGQYAQALEEEIDVRLVKSRESLRELLIVFKNIAPFVLTLRTASRINSYAEFVGAITSNEIIAKWLNASEEDWMSFVEILEHINDRMQIIQASLNITDDPLECIIETCQAAQKGYTILYRIDTSEVFMLFYQGNTIHVLSHNDFNEFLMHLRFASQERRSSFNRENSVTSKAINSFVSDLDILCQSFPAIQELYGAGYPKICFPNVVIRDSESPPLCSIIEEKACCFMERRDLTTLETDLADWSQKVKNHLDKHPCLSLLSVPVARRLSGMLQHENEEHTIRTVFNILSSFLGISELFFSLFSRNVKDALLRKKSIDNDGLEFLMHCLEHVVPYSNSIPQKPLLEEGGNKQCKLYRCETDADVFAVLCETYKATNSKAALLPSQVIWCDSRTNSSYLKNALRAARLFPEFLFSFLRTDLLPFPQQHLILEFLQTEETISNIQFIECGESALSLCERVTEESDKGVARGHNRKYSFSPRQKALAVSCFYGPSGCGKTFQLHRAMKAAQEKDSLLLFQIIVTEDFRLSHAIKVLEKAVMKWEEDPSRNRIALAIRFSLGCISTKKKLKWLQIFRLFNKLLFGLVEMRCIVDADESGSVLALSPSLFISLFIEFPPSDIFTTGSIDEKHRSFTSYFFPLLDEDTVAKFDCESIPFIIENDATEIAKYLKAYEDGTIDNKCIEERKEKLAVLFLLDASGSMRRNQRLEYCMKSIIQTCQKFTSEDYAGLVTFSTEVFTIWELNQCTKRNIETLEDRLDRVQLREGSIIYAGLKECVEILNNVSWNSFKKFIVVLSDGGVDGTKYKECIQALHQSEKTISILFIAIDVALNFEIQLKRAISPFARAFKWIVALDNERAISNAFGDVAQSLSVNEQIQKNAEDITEKDVHTLITKYMRPTVGLEWSRVQKALWIRYMVRRCKILASSTKFDKNTELAHYGSLTMKMMLLEAQHAVEKNHIVWENSNHEHMVYRETVIEKKDSKKTSKVDYQWSIIASHQENDCLWDEKEKVLRELGMYVPRQEDLSDPRVLETYLGYAIGARLEDPRDSCTSGNGEQRKFDFPLGRLPGIEEEGFILTLDFLMKMLLINERIKCRVPCIIMGETGVSKTKVTETLFSLKNNYSGDSQKKQGRLSYFLEFLSKNTTTSTSRLEHLCTWLRNIPHHLQTLDEVSFFALCSKDSAVRKAVSLALLEVFENDPSLDPLADMPISCLTDLTHEARNVESIRSVINWLLSQDFAIRRQDEKNWIFIPFNIHAGVAASEIKSVVKAAGERVNRLRQLGDALPTFYRHRRAEICIFFDEFNTTPFMGLLKEIILDRSLDGEKLPEALIPIAACNPFREKQHRSLISKRAEEQGADWVSGHYHVEGIPKPLEDMTWNYGSLLPSQEEEFIQRAFSFQKFSCDEILRSFIVKAVFKAHIATKQLAKEHLLHSAIKNKSPQFMQEIEERAASSVSLREILRFFRLFHFFRTGLEAYVQKVLFPTAEDINSLVTIKEIATLSVAFVYYFRLTSDPNQSLDFRKKFSQEMKEINVDIEGVVLRCIDSVLRLTNVGPWIVKTKSLSENIFVILFSIVSRTPLILKGPPGTSKTLAVKILASNTLSNFSHNEFYKSLPRLHPLHYQCSRSSSATEIRSVFEKAIQSQKYSDKHGMGSRIYFVFMDEAGLPEEDRESLKVLHYYLESSNNKAAEVGFIAITNQVLDSAKSNRCIMLSRVKYTDEELQQLAVGYIEESKKENLIDTKLRWFNSDTISLRDIISNICKRFEKFTSYRSLQLLTQLNGVEEKLDDWTFSEKAAEFFSFRDVMHFFKLLGYVLRSRMKSNFLSFSDLLYCFQRNFNGLESVELLSLLRFFFGDIQPLIGSPHELLFNPVELLIHSIKENQDQPGLPLNRYILIHDTTNSEGVLRALQRRLRIEHENLHTIRISLFPQTMEKEQASALSELEWRMNQGDVVMLVHSSSINESLYDLFNQHFHERQTFRTKRKYLETTIAVGSQSVVSEVQPSFNLIVVLNNEELNAAPAPFLDRLEKYSINMGHVLHEYLLQKTQDQIWNHLRHVIEPLHRYVCIFVESETGLDAFYGAKTYQTIESAIFSLLQRWEKRSNVLNDVFLHWAYLRSTLSLLPCVSCVEDIALWMEYYSATNVSDTHLLRCLLLQTAQRELLKVFLSISIPEFIFPCLTQEAGDLYLTEDNFLVSLSGSTHSAIQCNFFSREIIYTRSVSKNFYALIEERKETIHFVNLATTPTSRYELEEKIDRMWNAFPVLVIYMELSHSNMHQLTFIREYIDSLCKSEKKVEGKTIRVIVLVPPLDIITSYSYDTVFDNDWKLRFLDDLGEGEMLLPWMRFALERNESPGSISEEENLVTKFLEEPLTNSVQRLAGVLFVHFPSSNPAARYLHPNTILETLQEKVTVKGKETDISSLVLKLWRKKNKEDLANTAKRVILSHRELHQTKTLTQTIKAELQDSLATLIVLVVKEMFPCFWKHSDERSKTESASTGATLVWEVLESIDEQELHSLLKPLSQTQHIELPFSHGFPFYNIVFDFMRKFINHVLRGSKGQTERINWLSLIDAWSKASDKSPVNILGMRCVQKVLNMGKNEPLFRVYVSNTIKQYAPWCSTETQHYFNEWVLSQIGIDTSVPCMVQLHLLNATRGKDLFIAMYRIERIQMDLPHEEELISSIQEEGMLFTQLLGRIKTYTSASDMRSTASVFNLSCKLLWSALAPCSTMSQLRPCLLSEPQILRMCVEIYLAKTAFGSITPICSGAAGNTTENPCRKSLIDVLEDLPFEGNAPIDEPFVNDLVKVLKKHFNDKVFSVLLRIIAMDKSLFSCAETSSCFVEMVNVSDLSFMTVIISKHNSSGRPLSTFASFETMMSASFLETRFFEQIGFKKPREVYKVLLFWLAQPKEETKWKGGKEEKVGIIFLFVWQWVLTWFNEPGGTVFSEPFISRIKLSINRIISMPKSMIQCVALVALQYFITLKLHDISGAIETVIDEENIMGQAELEELLLLEYEKAENQDPETLSTFFTQKRFEEQFCHSSNGVQKSDAEKLGIMLQKGKKLQESEEFVFAPPGLSALHHIEKKMGELFSWEMSLISLSRHLWILPCIHDFSLWIAANYRPDIYVLPQIFDSYRHNQWNLLRAAVGEAKNSHDKLASLPDLPELQHFKHESCSLLRKVADTLINVYRIALKEGQDSGILSLALPTALSFDDFVNILGGNESFILELQQILKSGRLRLQDAKQLMCCQRHSFQVCSPMMNLLASLSIVFLAHSALPENDNSTLAGFSCQIHYFLNQKLVTLPEGLAHRIPTFDSPSKTRYPLTLSQQLHSTHTVQNYDFKKLFHRFHFYNLKKAKYILDIANQELCRKSSPFKDLRSFVKSWMETPFSSLSSEAQGVNTFFSEFIGFSDVQICALILSFDQQNISAASEFIEKEIALQGYIFWDKPVEVKKWLPSWVAERMKQVWDLTPKQELQSLLYFIQTQERAIVINAREGQEHHELLAVLAYSFPLKTQIFHHYPSLRKIERSLSKSPSNGEPFFLLTFHYVAVVLTLQASIAARKDRRDRSRETTKLSPIPMTETISWKFLVEYLLSRQLSQDFHDVRITLKNKLNEKDYSLNSVEEIENLLWHLPIDDTTLVVREARELVDNYRREQQASQESVAILLSSTSAMKDNSIFQIDTGILKKELEHRKRDRYSNEKNEVFLSAEELCHSILSCVSPAAPLSSPESETQCQYLKSFFH